MRQAELVVVVPFSRKTSRRSLSLRPIHSIKNIVNDLLIVGANTTNLQTVANAVNSATLGNQREVTRGSTINQVYIEMWLYGNAVAGVNSRIAWGLFKNDAGVMVPPNPSSAGTAALKKQYFAMGTGLVGSQANGQPGYLIRGWFKIPKGYRKMRSDDIISMVVRNDTANDVNLCSVFIYKWYE